MSIKLEQEVTRLHQESSDWSTQSRGLQAELQREREREKEERARRKEEREREREERMAKVQKLTEHFQKESKVIV